MEVEYTPYHLRHSSPTSTHPDDTISPCYGNIPLPHQCHTLTHGLTQDILSWHAGVPDGDPVDRCNIMDESDMESLGIDPAFAIPLAKEHYAPIEHWDNAKWVASDRQHHGGSYTLSALSDHNITDILKQIANWDKLSDITPIGWQAFYSKLRWHSYKWKIALVPFEAINLK